MVWLLIRVSGWSRVPEAQTEYIQAHRFDDTSRGVGMLCARPMSSQGFGGLGADLGALLPRIPTSHTMSERCQVQGLIVQILQKKIDGSG